MWGDILLPWVSNQKILGSEIMERKTIKNILNFLKEKEGKKLPYMWVRDLTQGKLIQELETHPDGIQYRHGSLDLSDTDITKLPNDLYVDGIVLLINCKELTELPSNLHVEAYLSLKGCENITELPNKLYVGSYLDLQYSGIKSLPEGLEVGGDLYLDSTNIKFLPKGLKVGSTLVLGYSSYLLNFSDDELFQMIDPNGNGEGYINSGIERS